jgi:hypothetical protein
LTNKRNAGIQRIFPIILPNLSSEADNSAGHQLLRLAVENPAALQLRLYSTEKYHRILFRRPLNPNANLLTLYSEGIRLLNKQMQNPATACSDSAILVVGGLGIFGEKDPKPNPISPSSLPAQGPLKELQGLSVYSQMIYNPVHLKGMDSMIKLRGGLSELRTNSVGVIISL